MDTIIVIIIFVSLGKLNSKNGYIEDEMVFGMYMWHKHHLNHVHYYHTVKIQFD